MTLFEVPELSGASVLNSSAPGNPRCLVICGAVHGNEPAGPQAIRTVRDLIKSGEWQVDGNIVGLIGNPEALERRERFIEENLNRAFGQPKNPASLEAIRAKEITAWFRDLAKGFPDMYLIDLHSVSMGETCLAAFNAENPRSKEWCQEISPMPFKIAETDAVFTGPITHAFENAGGIAIALECGNHTSLNGVTVALEHVERALLSLGVLKKNSVSFQGKIHYEGIPRMYTFYAAIKPHRGFSWDVPVESEFFVKAGTQFAHDELGPHIAAQDSYIIIPSKNPQPEDFDAGFLAIKN